MLSWLCQLYTVAFPPDPENLEFTFADLENTWNLNKRKIYLEFYVKPWKTFEICKFYVLRFTFQDIIYKAKIIYIFVISTFSTHTVHAVVQSQIDLEFHCFNLENTWNFVSRHVRKLIGTLSATVSHPSIIGCSILKWVMNCTLCFHKNIGEKKLLAVCFKMLSNV